MRTMMWHWTTLLTWWTTFYIRTPFGHSVCVICDFGPFNPCCCILFWNGMHVVKLMMDTCSSELHLMNEINPSISVGIIFGRVSYVSQYLALIFFFTSYNPNSLSKWKRYYALLLLQNTFLNESGISDSLSPFSLLLWIKLSREF